MFLSSFYDRKKQPGHNLHTKVISQMQVSENETVYVTADTTFAGNGLRLPSGVVLVREKITEFEEGKLPDMVVPDLKRLWEDLSHSRFGLLGESQFPEGSHIVGEAVPVTIKSIEAPIYALGRYFGKEHHNYNRSQYSYAVYHTIGENHTWLRPIEDRFLRSFITALRLIQYKHAIDAICSVPDREDSRKFQRITQELTLYFSTEDIQSRFKRCKLCKRQTFLRTAEEREKNVSGVFTFDGSLNNKHVVLIDDILASGSTVREAVKTLRSKGAEVTVIVLAIAQ